MYVDRTANSNTSYTYEVSAVDRTGNEGPKSQADPTLVHEEPLPPAFLTPSTNRRTFGATAHLGDRSIVVTVTAPEETTGPATVSLFSLDGRLAGRVVAARSGSGRYTAEFRRTGAVGVNLCRVRLDRYDRIWRIVSAKK